MTRKLTPAEVEDQFASMIVAAEAADHKRFESQLELGAILIQLQTLRTAYREISERLDRTFEEIVEHDFMIDVTRGYQFIKFRKIDEALREAGEPPLKKEGQARVVGPLTAYPDKLVPVVKKAREAAESEDVRLADRHLREARRALAPESYRGAVETHGESGTPDTPWPWGDDARDQFAKIPKRFRADVLESLTFASISEEVTPEMVVEAAAVVRAERDAPSDRKGWPIVVGVAVAIVEHNRRQLVHGDRQDLLDPEPTPDPIIPLDVVDRDYLVPTDAEGYVPDRGAKRPPLLVALATVCVPDAFWDAHPGARALAEGRAEVIVEIGELREYGGPFLNEVDEHGDTVLDISTIREASRAAGIEKELHPAGPGIEWAAMAVNCCTGCSHACARRFCYASDIALRYYPQAFVPTIWPSRLDAFENSDPPPREGRRAPPVVGARRLPREHDRPDELVVPGLLGPGRHRRHLRVAEVGGRRAHEAGRAADQLRVARQRRRRRHRHGAGGGPGRSEGARHAQGGREEVDLGRAVPPGVRPGPAHRGRRPILRPRRPDPDALGRRCAAEREGRGSLLVRRRLGGSVLLPQEQPRLQGPHPVRRTGPLRRVVAGPPRWRARSWPNAHSACRPPEGSVDGGDFVTS